MDSLLSMKLTTDDYLAHLRSDSARFRGLLAECPPGAPVPACPAWTAADLLWHLTEVHDVWTHVIRTRPAPPESYQEPERPASYDELLAGFDKASAGLIEALEAADAGDAAWSWSSDQTVGFTIRRQALEALVHRIDAEQTVGATGDVDPALAADGVDEVLAHFLGGAPPWGEFAALPHHVRIDLTDTGEVLWAQIGQISGTDPDGIEHHEDGIILVADPGIEPDAAISGTAAALLTRLWRRGDGGDTHLSGDLKIVDHFRRAIHHPIN